MSKVKNNQEYININNIVKQDVYNFIEIYCNLHDNKLACVYAKRLCSIFNMPCVIYFSSKDIYNFFNYLKKNLPTVVSQIQKKEHYELCEVLSKFFLINSEKLYEYKKKNKYKVDDKLKNLFKMSLKGKATGDSIGFLVEGESRSICEEYVKKVIKNKKFNEYGLNLTVGNNTLKRYSHKSENRQWVFKLGQYTDDTQLCRELIKNIIRYKKFVPEDFANRIIMLMGKSGLLRKDTIEPKDKFLNIYSGIVGYGTGTLRATQCLADGASWEQSGSIINSQGNGGCMRVAPLGVLYFDQPHKLKEISSLQSIGTHSNSRCRASCVMVSEAARLASESVIYPWSKHIIEHPTFFCDRLAYQVKSIDAQFSEQIKLIPDILKENNEQKIVYKIANIGFNLGDFLWDNGNVISASTVQTSLFAIVCFLKYPDSYEDAISMAIRAGGDTDTTAAIVGAIVAARTGNILDVNINDRGSWNSDHFDTLADDAMNAIYNN